MEIKEKDLKEYGTEVDCPKHTLWYNPKNQMFEITEYANTKNVYYRYKDLRHAVKTLNDITGYNDVAILSGD